MYVNNGLKQKKVH